MICMICMICQWSVRGVISKDYLMRVGVPFFFFSVLTCTSELFVTLVELAFRYESRVYLIARTPGILETEEGIRISRSGPFRRRGESATITRKPKKRTINPSNNPIG